jgi:hypothetical protein
MASSKYNYLPYHQRRTWRRLIAAGFIAGAFLGGIFAGKYIWKDSGRLTAMERDEVARQLEEADSIIDQLKLQIAIYENASLVDQLAVQNTQEDLKKLQGELLEMGKELKFYRRIVSPKKRDNAIRIRDLRMFHGQKFALTLSRGSGRGGPIRATVQIQFSGTLNGAKKVLKFHEVDQEGRRKLEFSFRYFQTETTSVNFPEGFELEKVMVTAKAHASDDKKISREWDVDELQMEPELSVSAVSKF